MIRYSTPRESRQGSITLPETPRRRTNHPIFSNLPPPGPDIEHSQISFHSSVPRSVIFLFGMCLRRPAFFVRHAYLTYLARPKGGRTRLWKTAYNGYTSSHLDRNRQPTTRFSGRYKRNSKPRMYQCRTASNHRSARSPQMRSEEHTSELQSR